MDDDDFDDAYSPETDKVLERVAERLAVRFIGSFSTETINRFCASPMWRCTALRG